MKKTFKCLLLKTNSKGFTLMEILVAISLSLLVIGSLYGIYISSYKSYRKSINKADLNQNVRIVLERISRDLRQTNNVITTLPSGEIKFQDGHDISKIRYINYYRDTDNNLHQKISHYYFPVDPSIYVRWNEVEVDGNGQPQLPLEETEPGDDVIKAEKITSLSFEGDQLITINITAADSENTYSARTEVLGRNIQ